MCAPAYRQAHCVRNLTTLDANPATGFARSSRPGCSRRSAVAICRAVCTMSCTLCSFDGVERGEFGGGLGHGGAQVVRGEYLHVAAEA